MTDSVSHGPPTKANAAERRQRPHLRELIDEMMASIRVAAGRDLWTAEERAKYEGELAQIMARVRSEAVGPEEK